MPYAKNGKEGYELLIVEKLAVAKEIIEDKAQSGNSSLEVLFSDFSPATTDFSFENRVLPCYARWVFPAIGIDGFLYPCCQTATEEFAELRIADLKKTDFWEAYYSYQYPRDTCSMKNSNCKCDRKALSVNNNLREKYHPEYIPEVAEIGV